MMITALVLKVTVVMTVALAGTRLARRGRAAVRHVLLAAAFVVLLVLPMASIVSPIVRVPMPAAVEQAIAPLYLEPMLESMPAPTSTGMPVVVPPAAPASPWPSLTALLIAGWIAGTAYGLLLVVVGLWHARSLRGSSLPWPEGAATIDALAGDAGMRRRVEVLLHEAVPGPMTCGVVRPAIVLPMDARIWPQDDLRRALVHELEHVRRADWMSQCLSRVVSAGYWFHPLVWIARRQLVLEAERACDDAVLRRSEATAYADQLVVLARRLSAAAGPPQLAMANRRDLPTRILAVLDGRQPRGRAGALWLVAAGVASALTVTAMSPLRIVATPTAAQAAPGQGASDRSQKFEVASIKPCAAEALPSTQPGGRAAGPGNATTSPGRAHWECATLDQLVTTAYAGVDHRLLNSLAQQRPGDPKIVRGAPSWAYADKFTIDAKAAGDADRATLIGPMLRALLEDRFKVKTHRATEERSVYALTVAKGGLKIKATAPGDCWAYNAVTQPGPPPGADNLPACGNLNMNWNGGNRTLTSTGVTLQHFSEGLLSNLMDRFVIDKTTREGEFNIPLEFAPDDSTPGGLSGLAWSRRAGATPATGPSIFKALEELGLKLEPTKAPAEYLVIDRAERPAPDFAAEAATSTAPPRFDAASIKPCVPEDPPPGSRGPRGTAGGTNASASPGRFTVPCVTLEQLIYLAYASYGAREDERLANDYLGTASDATKVRGGPAWVHSPRDKYAIEATAGTGVSDRTILMGAMLRTLLEERFQLEIHRESEDAPMYALRVAKSGLKLKPMKDGDCDPSAAGTPPPWTTQPCGFMTNGRVGPSTRWHFVGFQLSFLARQLSGPLGRHVIDETGVAGQFVINLEFLTDDTAAPDAAGGTVAPSLFTAVEQQLGLKLDATKGPRGFIVVDRAERPVPDAPGPARARGAGAGR